MNTSKIAKQIAETNGLTKAVKYDLFLREFDNMVELVGLVEEPNYDKNDYRGREMLFPKRWVTLGVFDSNYKVNV
jgi:hypothetical protein